MTKLQLIVAWGIILTFLSGCTSGKVSINRDEAKFDWSKSQKQELDKSVGMVYVGMSREELYKIYGRDLEKGYTKKDNREWITFSNFWTEIPQDTVTFHLT